jgi:hypothetical protein
MYVVEISCAGKTNGDDVGGSCKGVARDRWVSLKFEIPFRSISKTPNLLCFFATFHAFTIFYQKKQ